MLNKRISLLIFVSFICAPPGLAEEQGNPAQVVTPGSATPAAAPLTNTPTPTSKPVTNSNRATEIKYDKSLDSSKEKGLPKASQKQIAKYKSKVALSIASQARKQGSIGNGQAVVSFRIADNGKVTGVVVKSASSPKHAESARRIVSNIHAGPPPGGEILLSQRFRFD